MMTASDTIHEGNHAFMARALHFAQREVAITPRRVPFPASWLGYFIAYRSGMTVDAIANEVGVERRHISKRLLAIMAMLGKPSVRARVEALVNEMGRVHFENYPANTLKFPGPSVLSHRRLVS